MTLRNIRLAYFLTFCKFSWFWLGIWIFYYLRFTNYAGIGFLETVLVLTFTICEIPTGAIADLLGKRKTLIISFFIETIGILFLGLATNFFHLLLFN